MNKTPFIIIANPEGLDHHEIYREILEKNIDLKTTPILIVPERVSNKLEELRAIESHKLTHEDLKLPDMPANRSERRQMKKGKSISEIRKNKSKYIPE